MFTIEYKGGYINGYCDKDECSAIAHDGKALGSFRSVRAAKAAITRYINYINTL